MRDPWRPPHAVVLTLDGSDIWAIFALPISSWFLLSALSDDDIEGVCRHDEAHRLMNR